MTTTKKVASFIAAFFLTAPAARADHHEGGPKPAPELDQMKSMEGTWKCDGKMAAGAMGPGSPEMPYKSAMKVKRDKALGGFWYAGDYEMKKSKTFPGVLARFQFGWDPSEKKFVGFGADSMGGHRKDSTTGWEGDKLVITGDMVMMGKKVAFRETMTKKGDKEITVLFETKADKDFAKMNEETCKK